MLEMTYNRSVSSDSKDTDDKGRVATHQAYQVELGYHRHFLHSFRNVKGSLDQYCLSYCLVIEWRWCNSVNSRIVRPLAWNSLLDFKGIWKFCSVEHLTEYLLPFGLVSMVVSFFKTWLYTHTIIKYIFISTHNIVGSSPTANLKRFYYWFLLNI